MTKPFLGTPRKRQRPPCVPGVQQATGLAPTYVANSGFMQPAGVVSASVAPGSVVSPFSSVSPVFAGAQTAVPTPLIPAVPVTMLNPFFFLCLIRPAVEHGLREAGAGNSSVRHAIIEVALISILLAMGFDFRTALAIVESWEINDAFPGEDLFREDELEEYEGE